jgi:hypothetical protein
VVQWSSFPENVIDFQHDRAVLTQDCYAPLTIKASLRACDSFPATNFSKIVTLNVEPSVAGQIDLGGPSGLALAPVPVGNEMAIDLALFAPVSLKVRVARLFSVLFLMFDVCFCMHRVI